MIDVENEFLTVVKTAVGSTVSVSSTYEPTPKIFPHVQFEMTESVVDTKAISSERIENYANIQFEINIYSNKTNNKKAECKALAQTIDTALVAYGFIRTYYKPIPNIADMSIYRLLLRYSGKVGTDNHIYRS